jgi:hypothetical protein
MRLSCKSAFRRITATVTLLLLMVPGFASAIDIAVVTHPSVPIDDISFKELKKVLLGDREFWTAGHAVTLIVRAPVAAERTLLLETVYEMTESQYRRYWISKVFRAQAAAEPRIVLSSDEASELITVIEGAVGLIRADEVPDGLKILRVDGKLPADEDYRLTD